MTVLAAGTMLAASTLAIFMGLALGSVCVLLILIILIQKGRGGGLSSAFGGGGGGAFGAKTGDVFTGITVALALVFLLLTVFGNYAMRPAGANTGRSSVRGVPTQPAPGAIPVGGATNPGADDVDQADADTPEPSTEPQAQDAPKGDAPAENVDAPTESITIPVGTIPEGTPGDAADE